MMRMVAQITAAGVVGAILWELLGLLMPPLIAIFLGIMAMLFKFALVMIAIFGVIAWVKRRGGCFPEDDAD